MIAVVAVAALATAAYFSISQGRSNGEEVRAEIVERRNLTATVTASGNVRARRKVDISSDISARVTELLIAEGEDVEEGQELLRLDPSRYEAAVNRSRANLMQTQAAVSQARANFVRAEREADRKESLWERDSLLVSRQEVENARTDLEVQRCGCLGHCEEGPNLMLNGAVHVDMTPDRLSELMAALPALPLGVEVTR